MALTQILLQAQAGLHGREPRRDDEGAVCLGDRPHEGQAGSDKDRDRLLFQLSRAGVQVQDKNASIDELLELGTVAIGSTLPQEASPGKGRGLLLAAGGGVLVVIAIIVGIHALRQREQQRL